MTTEHNKDTTQVSVEEEVTVEELENIENSGADSSSSTTENEREAGEEMTEEQGTFTLEELQQKLAEAENRAEENYQKFLRTQADFDNFRRRTRKEKEDQAKYASLNLLEQLLPAVDNFERAIEASKTTQDFDSLVKGIDMVFKQLDQALQNEGLEVIPAVGEAFDPHFHQAVMQVEDSEFESGIVVEELQKGYKLKDKVIRPAMVKVSM
ncbi:nucleotide exchange factor GrpE [Caldalkalibacillus mannanilyticus]|uniref:nucleotide exchange factor GrpE n=1 Tax=Caldalkalibacillus mannanilyticus TaxID=1418 RepID=UPI00046954F6|nr:nucleotide exchange factor GrpE [Caldalkalibacillus mannanilyticus]